MKVSCPVCGLVLRESTVVDEMFSRKGTADAADLRELARSEGFRARLWDCADCGLWFVADALPAGALA
jgi:hypothetical protein